MEMGAKVWGVRRYRFKSLMNWAQTHSYLQINPQRRSKREAPPSPGDGGAENDHCCCSCWCSSLDVPPDEAIRGAGDGSPGKARGPGGIFRCEKHPAGWIGACKGQAQFSAAHAAARLAAAGHSLRL